MTCDEWKKTKVWPYTFTYQELWDTAQQAMQSEGWRQCAVGQRTTQFCEQLEAAILVEREACAKLCGDIFSADGGYHPMLVLGSIRCADAIRARSDKEK